MRDKLVVFDLDGTLLNTIGDLAVSCNHMLSKRGLKEHTYDDTCAGWQSSGQNRPFPTVCLFTNGEKCGGAGPMKQGKQKRAAGGDPCPAVIQKQLPHGRDAFRFQNRAFLHISHNNNWYNKFIGRKAKNKGK